MGAAVETDGRTASGPRADVRARPSAPPSDPVAFPSILFPAGTRGRAPPAPEAFVDLGLDQIIAAVTHNKDEYELTPFFRAPLPEVSAVEFRHEVMKDVERRELLERLKAFARAMGSMRAHLACAEKAYYPRQKQRWFLDGVEIYCAAVDRLVDDLRRLPLASAGLTRFREALTRYVSMPAFQALRAEAEQLKTALSAICYAVHIDGLHVQVRPPGGEPDYSAELDTVFERFKQRVAGDYDFKFVDSLDMSHVEAQILDMVAKLHPEAFAALASFAEDHGGYLDPGVAGFDRELQFYIAYLDHIAPLKRAGLAFCFPTVTRESKAVGVAQGFDLALAAKLRAEGAVPVCNDFQLGGLERIIVVTGPNQGGKTTFARMFGQLHYLASLGLPVPGARAQLFLFDQLFAHFERGENTRDQRGKLQDDLMRVHDILERASGDSVIVMNEIFTSTTLRDALALSKKIMARMVGLDLLSVWVTFIDELASLGDQTVSMVSTVQPEDPAKRTFQIVRRPADGLSHALSIAERHRLTYAQIKERLGQ